MPDCWQMCKALRCSISNATECGVRHVSTNQNFTLQSGSEIKRNDCIKGLKILLKYILKILPKFVENCPHNVVLVKKTGYLGIHPFHCE